MTYSRVVGSVLKEGLPVGKLHVFAAPGCTCADPAHRAHGQPDTTSTPQMLQSTVRRIRAVEAECVLDSAANSKWYKTAALGWQPDTHNPHQDDDPEAEEMYGYFRDAVI
ncbi:hypothetical protein LTR85_008061 [Meristemomyces frigidus]|nr:hypothetical protein LTR85_008061 [Meristemomyces frigidus]